MTVCLLQMMINGIRDITTVHLCSTKLIILIINNISTKHSNQSNQFWWSQEESMILMRWTKSKELECQIIPEFQRTEIFTGNLVGFLTLTLSAQKTIMPGTLQIESISMVLWITMLLLTIQQWQTPNSSDKTLHQSQLQEKEFKPWVFKINPSMAPQWDQLKAHSKHQFMLLLSYLIEIFLTNGKTIKKFMTLSSLQMPFHSWDSHILSGIKWLNHHEEETKSKTKLKKEVTLKEQTTLSHKALVLVSAKRRE